MGQTSSRDVERTTIRILLRGNEDLTDSTMSKSGGGRKLDHGLQDVVAKAHPTVDVKITHEPCNGVGSFRQLLAAGAIQGGTSAFQIRPSVVVLSLHADLFSPADEVDPEVFLVDLRATIKILKNELGSHVVVLNASTLDPSIHVSNYRSTDHEPPALTAHKLNLILLRLSFEEGISIVDADRLLAEIGGATNVKTFLDYSPAAAEAICQEFHRVLEDYGFFDDRPLVMQIGRSSE